MKKKGIIALICATFVLAIGCLSVPVVYLATQNGGTHNQGSVDPDKNFGANG